MHVIFSFLFLVFMPLVLCAEQNKLLRNLNDDKNFTLNGYRYYIPDQHSTCYTNKLAPEIQGNISVSFVSYQSFDDMISLMPEYSRIILFHDQYDKSLLIDHDHRYLRWLDYADSYSLSMCKLKEQGLHLIQTDDNKIGVELNSISTLPRTNTEIYIKCEIAYLAKNPQGKFYKMTTPLHEDKNLFNTKNKKDTKIFVLKHIDSSFFEDKYDIESNIEISDIIVSDAEGNNLEVSFDQNTLSVPKHNQTLFISIKYKNPLLKTMSLSKTISMSGY